MSVPALRPPVGADVFLPMLLDALDEGVLVVDRAQAIRLANRAARNLCGYALDRLMGESLRTLLPEADLGVWLKRTRRPRPSSDPNLAQIPQVTLRRADGSSVAVEVTLKELGLHPQQHLVVVLRDLSERARLAEHFARIRKLSLVGAFAGGAARELTDLLLAIQVASDGLSERLDDAFSPDARVELEQLRAAAERGSGVAARLLAFGCPAQLELVPADLVTVLNQITPTLRQLLPSWIGLNCRAEPGPLLVLAASGAIEEILLELVTNARRAMPHGGLLTVDLRRVRVGTTSPSRSGGPPPGDYVCLSVDDTGSGLSAEARTRVFGAGLTMQQQDGSGFGTAMVLGLVRQHGGHVTLNSAPHRGTTVSAFLPVLQQATRTLLMSETRPGQEPMTVLIVDDEESLLRIAQRALQRSGYRVITASRGADALAELRNHRGEISVVVSDLSMPGLGGRQLREAALQEGIELPFVFTSGHAPGDTVEPFQPQEASFLRKPWSIDDLLSRVREAAEHRH